MPCPGTLQASGDLNLASHGAGFLLARPVKPWAPWSAQRSLASPHTLPPLEPVHGANALPTHVPTDRWDRAMGSRSQRHGRRLESRDLHTQPHLRLAQCWLEEPGAEKDSGLERSLRPLNAGTLLPCHAWREPLC